VKQLRAEVLKSAFEHFRHCGKGEKECIVYLTSDADSPQLIDGVLHPPHGAGPAGYDLDSQAIADMWTELLADRRSIQVQVHTHPGPAYHSRRDDEMALVNSTGTLSLVIPDFAQGPIGLRNAFLARVDEAGSWTEAPMSQEIEVVE
jgi:hypothetical protein